MDSTPHTRRPLQSEGDPLQVSEPLGQLQLDEPADDGTNLSTPTRSALPSSQSRFHISDKSRQELCEELELVIESSCDDARLRGSLKHVWLAVFNALFRESIPSTRLADLNGFKENVQKNGEEQFFDLLKDIAKKKNWGDLLENRTFIPFV